MNDVAENKTKEKLPTTRGEWMFNILDWGGIGAIVNAGLSVFIADNFLNGRGKDWFNKKLESIENKKPFWNNAETFNPEKAKESIDFLKTSRKILEDDNPQLAKDWGHLELSEFYDRHIKNVEEVFTKISNGKETKAVEEELSYARSALRASGGARSAALLGLLMLGGTILMAPIKKFEDSKLSIVKKFDNMFGSNDPEIKKQVEARHKEIESEPKQTWRSVLIGRFTSLSIIYGLYFGFKDSKNLASEIGFDGTNKYFKKWSETIIEKAKNSHIFENKTKKIEKSLGKDRLNSISDLALVDLIYGHICAGLTFGFSRILAPFFDKEKKSSNENSSTDKINDTIIPLNYTSEHKINNNPLNKIQAKDHQLKLATNNDLETSSVII